MIKRRYTKESIEVIDITPTWSGLLPALIEVAVNGTTIEGRRNAMSALKDMAGTADAYAAMLKKVSTTDEA